MVVVHLAARVHVMHESARDSASLYRETNTLGTLKLAQDAARAGVQRFIFVSTAKVNGEASALEKPFQESDLPAPSDDYSISKYEAEEALRSLAKDQGMQVVIIRPPLVYGPGVKANFAALMRAVQRGVPLPLAAVPQPAQPRWARQPGGFHHHLRAPPCGGQSDLFGQRRC